MCVVGRSGVRSGVLPEPPDAEMSVGSGRKRRLAGQLSRDDGGLFAAGRMGTGGGAGSPGSASVAGLVPGAGRWQVAGGVHHPRRRNATRSAGVARRLLADPPDRLADVAEAWKKEIAA